MLKTPAVLLISLCLMAAGSFAQEQISRPSVALVLSGGGARGFAHIAVLEVIEEMGIPLDMIVGISSGAIIGGLYASGYSTEMMLKAMSSTDWASFFSDRPVSPFIDRNNELPLVLRLGGSSWPITPEWELGFSTGQKAYEALKSFTLKIPSYQNFDRLPIPFRAGAVEIPTGKFELFAEGDLAEVIRASSGIQGVFEPFDIDGRKFSDGGLVNNLPVREVREMGFDIIIAVDLFSPPSGISTNLLDLPDLAAVIFSDLTSRDHRELADVVIFPLIIEMPAASITNTALDFYKGMDIYTHAKEQREMFAALLEPVREVTAIRNHKPVPRDYEDKPYLVPQKIVINGALSRDISYIERSFSRLIMGKPLEIENITGFLDRIYSTGNYRNVIARVCNEACGTDIHVTETYLRLVLYPHTQNMTLFRAGLDYEGTFSSSSFGNTALRSGLEFFGKNGFSLLLRTSVFDELSAGLSVLQPLGPQFFMAVEADIAREQEMIEHGILSREEIIPHRLLYFHGALKAGYRFNRYNSFVIWPEYLWLNDDVRIYSMAGAGAAYTFSSLDHLLFPFRGFRGRVKYRLRFAPHDSEPFNLVSADLTGMIPLGSRFSFGISGFASSLFGSSKLPSMISTFDPGENNRDFFPHASGVFTGENRAAVSAAIHYKPFESLSIVGGRLIFSLAGSAGRAGSFEWNNWENFDDELVWNVSFGTGLVFIKNFGLQLRAGVGSGTSGDASRGDQPMPFVALDVGMSGFQKRLIR